MTLMIPHSDIVAKNRKGVTFRIGEEIMMVDSPIQYPAMLGQLLIIEDIIPWDNCESGFMIQVKHKETGKSFKSRLDTNWFKKTK